MSDAGIAIRPITCADRAELARVLADNDREQITATFNPFPMTAETARYIACGDHRDAYFVAEAEGRMVALGMLRGWTEGYTVPSFGVFVDYRCHGRGIGREMTAHCIAEARRRGCERVRLTVYKSNARALRLYESLGFREVGREVAPTSHARAEALPDAKLTMMLELPALPTGAAE